MSLPKRLFFIETFEMSLIDCKKQHGKDPIAMDTILPLYDPEAYRFHSIREFQESMRCAGEAIIEWKGIEIGFWSEKERHFSDHDNPKKHTAPHDHMIDWSQGFPDFQPQINYPDGNIPEFKQFQKESQIMEQAWEFPVLTEEEQEKRLEENRFESLSDFQWSLRHGKEIEIEYRGKCYGIFYYPESYYSNGSGNPAEYELLELYVENQEETERWCKTMDELLNVRLDQVPLREVVVSPEVVVWGRNL